MRAPSEALEHELDRWLKPFLACLTRRSQRRWATVYVKGLLLPGGRKSIEPLAERVAPGEMQQLHHFIAASPWAAEPLEEVLAHEADRLAGGPGAVLAIGEIALTKQGSCSVGVARQYCSELGHRANCQVLVSLTLCNAVLPVPVGLRLYLPEAWCAEPKRQAGMPNPLEHRPKWRIALDELDRLLARGLRFDRVTAAAGFDACADFRHGLAERGLAYAAESWPTREDAPLIVWRGHAGSPFAARLDAPRATRGGAERNGGYALADHVLGIRTGSVTGAIETRWACEQAHRILREELGLGHFEGRSWCGLHHHALMVMIAFCFLQHLQLACQERDAVPGGRAELLEMGPGELPSESCRPPVCAPARRLS